MDDSISVLSRAIDADKSLFRGDRKVGWEDSTPKLRASTWILHQIVSAGRQVSSPAYEDFTGPESKASPPQYDQFTQARLALEHTSKPDLLRALHFLERANAESSSGSAFWNFLFPPKELFVFIIKTAQMLEKQGDHVEA